MFEFDEYEKRFHTGAADPVPVAYQPVTDIEEMSFLHWGEHCIECAAPDCYATCDLYQSRPDGNCRRFAYGIYKNKRFSSLRGYGAEISFKTWGRLKANGNTRMEPIGRLLWKERLIGFGVPLLNAVGSALYASTGNRRWKNLAPDLDRIARRSHRRANGGRRPDLFLIEVFNPQPHPVTIQLTMRIGEGFYDDHPDPASLPPPLTVSVRLEPGYSCHRVERHLFAAITDSGIPFKLTLVPEGDDAVKLVFLTLDFVTTRRGVSRDRRPEGVKCVVFDLDNTLWEGVLLEGETLRANEKLVRLIHELDRRGILLSIASKNDHDHAWQKVREFGLSEYFLHPQINWRPKSENIERISAALDIGLNTFAFIDDNLFELEEVSRRLPEVTCIHVDDVDGLLHRPRFEGSKSVEAKNRRRYYQEAILRDADQIEYKNDYNMFLASCETKLEISPYDEADFDRVVELAQRTNQLNFSGTKYKRPEVASLLADQDLEKYVLRCSDKYGSYGTVGLGLVRRREHEIRVEEFMLSCRVQGRLIEQAFFHHLLRRSNAAEFKKLRVNFHPTSRNKPAAQVLHRLDFRADAAGDGLSLDISEHSPSCEYITIVSENDTPDATGREDQVRR
jgi:FkbH-like protein